MMKLMEGKMMSSKNLPPGFRFHPTDEELIMHYLKNQAMSRPCPVSIIPEIDIYKFDPWELPDKTEFGEKEWYFFSPRDRKYPNGNRPNRATGSGYWKATGTDKAIYSGAKYVGIKKALVFYKGKPPKGLKTDWIMHEYRLTESRHQPVKQRGSMRLDDWVLCRIYKKRHVVRAEERSEDSSSPSEVHLDLGMGDGIGNEIGSDVDHQEEQKLKFPRTHSLTYLLDLDYLGPIAHLLNDDTDTSSYNSGLEFQMNVGNNSGFDPNFGPFSSCPSVGSGYCGNPSYK